MALAFCCSVDLVRITLENCVDHVMVFSAWTALLLLSVDRFIYITMGLKHRSLYTNGRYEPLSKMAHSTKARTTLYYMDGHPFLLWYLERVIFLSLCSVMYSCLKVQNVCKCSWSLKYICVVCVNLAGWLANLCTEKKKLRKKSMHILFQYGDWWVCIYLCK